jgi:hypothetical protein
MKTSKINFEKTIQLYYKCRETYLILIVYSCTCKNIRNDRIHFFFISRLPGMWYIVEFVNEHLVDYIPELWVINPSEAYWPRNNVSRRREKVEKPFSDVYYVVAIRVMGTAGKIILEKYFIIM